MGKSKRIAATNENTPAAGPRLSSPVAGAASELTLVVCGGRSNRYNWGNGTIQHINLRSETMGSKNKGGKEAKKEAKLSPKEKKQAKKDKKALKSYSE